MIVLYNPHVDDFMAQPPHFRFLRRRPLRKYGFIIDELLKHGEPVNVVIDSTISAFVPEQYFRKLPKYLRRLISAFEFFLWVRINGLKNEIRKVKVGAGKQHRQILLMFSYKGATGLFSERLPTLEAFPAVIVHLSHYFISTAEKSENLRQLSNAWLAGDSDIRENPYFRHFFGWYKKPFVIIPFAVAPRFTQRKSFSERKQKIVATGSYHNLDDEVPRTKYIDYKNFFETNTYHPVRKQIYETNKDVDGQIDSYVTPYRVDIQNNRLKRLLKHFLVAQKTYFNLDIIELYNEYQFAVIGEEASGFPALGSFEAMACGAILIGNPEAYNGLGLKSGEHYLAHDGSIEGMLSVMQEVAQDSAKAVQISENGKRLVDNYFRSDTVYRRLNLIVDAILDEKVIPTL